MNKETKESNNEIKKTVNEETSSEKPTEKTKENEEISQLKAEIKQLKNDKLYLLAETENVRKNFWRQMEEAQKYSNRKILLWVLNFLVDLEERVLKALREDPEPKVKMHTTGVEMMKNELWKNLEKEGIKEIKIQPQVDLWDSSFQEISGEVENNELPEWTIVEVKEKGYMLHNQLLRPAKVVISKKSKN